MSTEIFIEKLAEEEQKKLAKLDSLLRTKDFREKLKTSPAETLSSEGFDIPKDAKFVFIDDKTKVRDNKGKDGIFYIYLKDYESGYVDTEEFKNVDGGMPGSSSGMAAVAAGVIESGFKYISHSYRSLTAPSLRPSSNSGVAPSSRPAPSAGTSGM